MIRVAWVSAAKPGGQLLNPGYGLLLHPGYIFTPQ
ncbi:Uncharacterised protein [Legionella steigerwaltii]|uniref:Uncharacterized protein n=1 Tax=Legionella steigerwaltii TaxID=460 RepID=A0A378L8H8_9GAMM|nr:Uncharacterised protein [Legionella steigerwaltii]